MWFESTWQLITSKGKSDFNIIGRTQVLSWLCLCVFHVLSLLCCFMLWLHTADRNPLLISSFPILVPVFRFIVSVFQPAYHPVRLLTPFDSLLALDHLAYSFLVSFALWTVSLVLTHCLHLLKFYYSLFLKFPEHGYRQISVFCFWTVSYALRSWVLCLLLWQ